MYHFRFYPQAVNILDNQADTLFSKKKKKISPTFELCEIFQKLLNFFDDSLLHDPVSEAKLLHDSQTEFVVLLEVFVVTMEEDTWNENMVVISKKW